MRRTLGLPSRPVHYTLYHVRRWHPALRGASTKAKHRAARQTGDIEGTFMSGFTSGYWRPMSWPTNLASAARDLETAMEHAPLPPSHPLGPSLRIGHYEVVAELQSGGMVRVFSAIDSRSGQRVAIKTLVSRDAVGIEYFRREIDTLSTLHHPAIVPFREHGVSNGQ